MNAYEFKLAPAYCLFNGVAINEQKDGYIQFLIENIDNEILKERLRRSFENHLESIRKMKNLSSVISDKPIVKFLKGNRVQIRKYVSSLYAVEDRKDTEKQEKQEQLSEAAAVLLLDRILNDARVKKATDIHIENKLVRFRVNGKLEIYMKLSEKRSRELIQRIKILGRMNVLEKVKSQDGHFVYGNKNPMFIRVSSVNVIDEIYNGQESIVLRLLDTSRIPLHIDDLGFNENQLECIAKLEEKKNGLVLICGPTGSGKSTTAASILLEIEKKSSGGLKIISLEDPPEYFIPGITQIKIDTEKNNFISALNHMFRLDPDVILIGEIRDELSAATALKAALTGHLVFATIHTSCVSESILRMENLGVDRALLASVLRGVICQELNFIGKEMKLYGDVGIPVTGLQNRLKKDLCEDEIEKLFIHVTNYSEIFSKTLELFKKKNIELVKREKRNQRIWKVNKKNGKVYKRIV